MRIDESAIEAEFREADVDHSNPDYQELFRASYIAARDISLLDTARMLMLYDRFLYATDEPDLAAIALEYADRSAACIK